jgi:RNA polymerase sigma factor (sigma-70 family)
MERADKVEAFLELIRLHGEKAYNFAFRLAGNEPDARDLVQEALTRAFERQDSYDPQRTFESWLCRILQNIYLDGVRRYAHKHTVSLDTAPPTGEGAWEEILPSAEEDPADEALRREAETLAQKALDALPIHYRTAVVLSDIEGYSYERIAEVMACPVGTVRSRIHQGRVLLRRAFDGPDKAGG